MDFAKRKKAPIFSFAWSTTLSHGDTNMIQLVDGTYSQLLESLLSKGHLNNTILFFMGDHGYRFGKIRETLIGYYEDRLPNMWIYLPKLIKEMYPDWEEALEINSR
jgi:arylsulfatase A-like enzyme